MAWADHLSRGDTLAGRERAVRLAPRVPEFHERLAQKLESLGSDSIPQLKLAAALDPANANRLQRLGVRAEFAGDYALAESSLLRAASLSRLYQPRYLLAQYYFRRQNADSFWRWYRAALDAAYGESTPLLELGLRMSSDPDSLARQAASERPLLRRQYLAMFLREHRNPAAEILARRVAEEATTEDLPVLMACLEHTLSGGARRGALIIWNTLCLRKLAPYQPLEMARGAIVTDPGFTRPPLGAGFGWRVETPEGVGPLLFRDGLHATFSGGERDDPVIVWQYVPLQPGIRYRLVESPMAEGLQWRILYPVGDGSWKPIDADLKKGFAAPADVTRLALTYHRPPGAPRLAGEVVIGAATFESAR